MTAPDYRQHLLPTDLRTPEDVLDWLARPRCCKTVEGLVHRLRARIDRERRQACRRGARIRFGYFAWYARLVRADKDWELDNPELASEMAWDDAADCLAFRAAARQP